MCVFLSKKKHLLTAYEKDDTQELKDLCYHDLFEKFLAPFRIRIIEIAQLMEKEVEVAEGQFLDDDNADWR